MKKRPTSQQSCNSTQTTWCSASPLLETRHAERAFRSGFKTSVGKGFATGLAEAIVPLLMELQGGIHRSETLFGTPSFRGGHGLLLEGIDPTQAANGEIQVNDFRSPLCIECVQQLVLQLKQILAELRSLRLGDFIGFQNLQRLSSFIP